jgi:hypothetical protein
MATTGNTYTGDGTTTDYAVPFDYISTTEVAVSVSAGSGLFTFVNASLIRFTTPPANGVTITISRATSTETAAVTFQNGSGFSGSALNRMVKQLLFAIQELKNNLSATVLTSGNVPVPGANVGKWLKATGASAWAWTAIAIADLSDATANAKSLLGMTYAQMKTALGIDNVSNTSDANKPVSTAQATAISGAQAAAIAQATTDRNAAFTGRARFEANKNGTDQTGVAAATYTKVTMTNEAYDIGSYYDAANSRWTPPAGVVRIVACVYFSAVLVAANVVKVSIYKNGSEYKVLNSISGATIQAFEFVMHDVANGTDQYELYVNAAGTGAKTISGLPGATFWYGEVIG